VAPLPTLAEENESDSQVPQHFSPQKGKGKDNVYIVNKPLHPYLSKNNCPGSHRGMCPMLEQGCARAPPMSGPNTAPNPQARDMLLNILPCVFQKSGGAWYGAHTCN
jgi:hypothetical protein